MISYKLIVQNTVDNKTPEQRVVVSPNDTNYKEIVLKRNLANNRYKAGDRVKMRKSATRGNVCEVITDINIVNWSRNRPHFLVVQWDDGKTNMCNSSQLKASKI